MSTGSPSPSPFNLRQLVSKSSRSVFLLWVALAVGAWCLYSSNITGGNTAREGAANRQEPLSGSTGDSESGPSGNWSVPPPPRPESPALAARLERIETAVENLLSRLEQREQNASSLESERAVQKAKVASLVPQIESARSRLIELKRLQAASTAQEASLLDSAAGRRIAGSSTHLTQVMDILDFQRPTAEQVAQWESQLDALAEPVLRTVTDANAPIMITAEHAQALNDLGQTLAEAVADFEQQQFALNAIQRETAGLPPSKLSLAEVIGEQRAQTELAEAERLIAVRKAARADAEEQHAQRLATIERELVAAKTKREEEKLLAEKARDEQLAKLELEQMAEEARVQETQRLAAIAELKEAEARGQEALRLAQLAREMERDLPQIQRLLMGFTTSGFEHRTDGKKGPASLAVIKGSGALEPTETGLLRLLYLACAKNDRHRGGLPEYIGGNVNWKLTSSEPVERAQELLIKYGELMVTRGMLAP